MTEADPFPDGSGGGGADRATSTTVSFVLTLAITALLASGLLIAAGSAVESQQERIASDELKVIGEQTASRLMAADRLNMTGAETIRIEFAAPARVAGVSYTVTLEAGSPPQLVLVADDLDVEATIPVPLRSDVAEGAVAGGDLRIVLTGAGELEVRSA